MSGVSRTEERQRHAYFSAPYYVGGKTVISRCKDAPDFSSFADVDQKHVRVIVNPGGTNEAFVDANVRNAEKVLYADNRTIFQQLLAGFADVMITDSIEVEWQTARNPDLCRAFPGTLTVQVKAFLLPRDENLRKFVDHWLSQRLADGTVGAAFSRQGVEPGKL